MFADFFKCFSILKWRYLLVAGLCLAVIACGDGEGDDLDQFMRDASQNLKPAVKPLPEVKPYIGMPYNAEGTLPDPFHPRKAASKPGALQPDMRRPREPMESYPLESLKYVGMLSKNKLTYALLKTPDNRIQQVQVGNYVGQNFGRVVEIAERELTLREIVQDELSGEWVEYLSKLALQE